MKTAIVTSFDDNYLTYSRVAIKTLGLNYHGEPALDVVCLVPESLLSMQQAYSDSLGQANLNIIFKTSSKFLDLVSEGSAIEVNYWTSNAYQRIFIGSTLPEYDEVIYIDPDTIFLRDIQPLLDYTSNSPFMAVIETVDSSKKVFGKEDIPHFNSGVFKTDLSFWRSEDIETKVVDWIRQATTVVYADQDSLNAILMKYLSPMPFSFNFFEYILENNMLMAREYDNPLIVHFVGADKPWKEKTISKYGSMWKQVFSELPVLAK
jgi:lipopolysaccharide biosynthesis glycosyltransferase